MDGILKTLSDFTFDIDKESRVILGIIAKHGPVTETKIASLGKRRIILTRDIIRRRLIFTDLSSDFLTVKKGKKIGNLKGKREKLYSLSFKGFLASLRETPIQENFWIKHYIDMVKKITDELTAKVFLDHIYYSIGAFLILHSNKRGMLTTFKNPEEEFYDNYDDGSSLDRILWSRTTVRIPSEYQEMFAHCVVQFFVSCEVIGSLLKNALQKKQFPKYLVKNWDKPSYMIEYEITDDLFRQWMWTMFITPHKTLKEILKECDDDGDYEDEEDFSFEYIIGDEPSDEIRFMAEKEFRRIKPKGKLSGESLVQQKNQSQTFPTFRSYRNRHIHDCKPNEN